MAVVGTNSGDDVPEPHLTNIVVEDVVCPTAQSLLEYLDPTDHGWGGNRVPEWVFRGQGDDWPILPSAWRLDVWRNQDWAVQRKLARQYAAEWLGRFPKRPVLGFRFPKNLPKEYTQTSRVRRLLTQIYWEYLLEARFVELADETGIVVSTVAGPQQIESIRHLNAQGAAPEPSQATAFAQHHGVPTRLIDWTRRSSVAAYFAAAERVRPTGDAVVRKNQGPNIAVFALNLARLRAISTPFDLDPSARELHPGLCVMPSRRAGHSFLHAQDGLFTWTHGWERYFIGNGKPLDVRTALEIAAAREQYKGEPILRRVLVPAGEAKAVLKLLERQRVTKASLMPTLDNVVDTIRIQARTYHGRPRLR